MEKKCLSNKNPFDPDFKELPDQIPVFPLYGVLLLPGGKLPLNVFEPRYLDMVQDALRADRIIGMIQPENREDETSLFKTGCAGRITEFEETNDGRYLLVLSGLCRFDVSEELSVTTKYRKVKADWSSYRHDMEEPVISGIERELLLDSVGKYFCVHDLTCDWERVQEATCEDLVTCLSMVCPFNAFEKQKLLEAKDHEERAEKFIRLIKESIENAVLGGSCGCSGCPSKCH